MPSQRTKIPYSDPVVKTDVMIDEITGFLLMKANHMKHVRNAHAMNPRYFSINKLMKPYSVTARGRIFRGTHPSMIDSPLSCAFSPLIGSLFTMRLIMSAMQQTSTIKPPITGKSPPPGACPAHMPYCPNPMEIHTMDTSIRMISITSIYNVLLVNRGLLQFCDNPRFVFLSHYFYSIAFGKFNKIRFVLFKKSGELIAVHISCAKIILLKVVICPVLCSAYLF